MFYISRRSFCLLLILLAPAIEDSHAQSFVRTGNMMMPRVAHTATLLQDGRVLVAGGSSPIGFYGNSPQQSTSTAEIYDPATGAFTSTGHMSVAQWVYSAILLKDGRALVSGSGSIEVFDPATGAFTPLNWQYFGDPMILLSDGEVLLESALGFSLYDPAGDGFRQLPLGWHISRATGTPLLDGSLFLVGGSTDYGETAIPHTYVFYPATQTLKTTADMAISRDFHT